MASINRGVHGEFKSKEVKSRPIAKIPLGTFEK